MDIFSLWAVRFCNEFSLIQIMGHYFVYVGVSDFS